MTKIISNATCGNSPKMEFLKDFNIAFATGNVDFLLENVTDEIVWTIIGDKKIEGRDSFAAELKKMKDLKPTELILDQILTHGKEGAANGVIKMHNNKKYAFSDFYIFNGTKGSKIKTITSYVIEI